MATIDESGEIIEDYSKIINVTDGRVYFDDFRCICGVYKIGINDTDVSIDCFDKNDKLIGYVCYKLTKDTVYCEDDDANKTIYLAENGELTC